MYGIGVGGLGGWGGGEGVLRLKHQQHKPASTPHPMVGLYVVFDDD